MSTSASSPYSFSSNQAAEIAVREISLHLFKQARSLEAGVLQDTDSEQLHQYRVNLRRFRSLVSCMKHCLGQGETEELKKQIAGLSKATGKLRDLDVFLARQSIYSKYLADQHRPGFANLTQNLADERAQAFGQIQRHLQSKTYAKTCRQISASLKHPAKRPGKSACQAVQQVASRKLIARYRKSQGMAMALNKRSKDQDIHNLRIECKKLRYMLESFCQLYPRKPVKKLIIALKKLQNHLGRFNDYAVQAELLSSFTDNPQTPKPSRAAAKSLRRTLHRKQRSEQRKVLEKTEQFFNPGIAQQFEQLIQANSKG